MRFEIAPKEAALNVRLSGALLATVKAGAKAKGIPYARYVRMLLEADVALYQRRSDPRHHPIWPGSAGSQCACFEM